jgi:CHAT domain-containing protein
LLLKEKENANADYLAETLVQIGRSYLALSDPEMAERSFKRALALRNPAGGSEWAFHSTLGLAQAELIRKRYDTALQYALDAQALRSDPADGSGSWELSATAGRAYKGLGRSDEARQQFEKAIGSIESSLAEVVGDQNEKQKYFGDRADVYYEMIDLLLSAGKVQEAMECVERVKARALVTTIQNGKVDISRGLSDSERTAERQLLNELSSLHARIGKVMASDAPDVKLLSELSIQTSKKRLEFEGFRNQLYARHPETKMYRGSLQTRSPDNTRPGFAGPETVVIEYSISKDKVTGFIVEAGRQKPTSLKVFVADTNEVQLRSAIRSVTKQFAEGSLEFRAGARQLYDLLLKPAAAQLAGKSNLIIVPDGPLWDLPFQALMDEKGKYLAEKMAVSYAPSLTALREMQKKARSRKPSPQAELLAFGNPIVAKETSEKVQRVFMSEKLEPIPEAERLVNELGRMYGPERSKIFTGSNAREETAKAEAPKYRIVQFATHGILNNASPMYSHLVLAQNDKNPNEDGLLEAWELKDLDLKADMVILSACDTARGRISAGEGIIGMTWASFIAGAPTTVASQWKVESRSTTELMLEFHRQLLKGNVSKAEALRRAQLKLLRDPKYRHPSYWAAWVIVGDAS